MNEGRLLLLGWATVVVVGLGVGVTAGGLDVVEVVVGRGL
jgi:hypothetical protein